MRNTTLILLLFGLSVSFPTAVNPAASYDEPEAEQVEAEQDEAGEAEPPKPFVANPRPEGKHQPWRLVRSLQRAQDRIVAGNKDAAKAYRFLLVQSANWMDELDDEAWQSSYNIEALAVYLLIGGDVTLGYKALQRSRLDAGKKSLLEAAIAYSERDIGRAYELLAEIDHSSLPPSLAAQVALARSMVHSSSNLEKAAGFLDEARWLAPGTLVEEAATRRAIRIAAELKNVDRLRYYFRTYLNRFASSHYFNDYLRNVSFAFSEVAEADGGNVIPDFEMLIDKLDNAQKAAMGVYVMRKAAMAGRDKLAAWFYEETIPLLAENSKFRTRLHLYSLATEVTNAAFTAKILAEAEAINLNHLEPQDRQILDAIRLTGGRIMSDSLVDEQTEDQLPDDLEVAAGDDAAESDKARMYELELKPRMDRLNRQVTELDKLAKRAMR